MSTVTILLSEFGEDGCDIPQFTQEVSAEIPSFQYANGNTTSISLSFSSELTSEETTTLNNLVANHVPDEYLRITDYPDFILSGDSESSTTNTEYTFVKSFIYPGKARTGYPGSIRLVAIIEPGVSSGSARIYDYTNKNTIAELTNITTTSPTILSMDFDKTKLPVNQAEFHIHLKRSSAISTKKITFLSLLLDYIP